MLNYITYSFSTDEGHYLKMADDFHMFLRRSVNICGLFSLSDAASQSECRARMTIVNVYILYMCNCFMNNERRKNREGQAGQKVMFQRVHVTVNSSSDVYPITDRFK